MAASPISIKLRCASWKQLAAIYERDLARNAVFLKSAAPPPVGTKVRINLTLPTQTLIVLNGAVDRHVGPGELNGRGPGVDIRLFNVPQSALWLIESALESARQKGALPAAAAPPKAASQDDEQPPATAPKENDIDMASGDKLVEAEGDLVTALSQELASLRKLNPFQILGVGYETTDDQVRAAFGALTKRYHPDRFARYQSGEARKVASEIFILIRNAYQHLDTADKRAKVVEALNKKRRAAKQAAAMNVTPAKQGATPPPIPSKPPPIPSKPPPVPATPPEQQAPAQAEPPSATPAAETASAPAAETASAPPPADGAPDGAASGQSDIERAYALLDAGKHDEALSVFRLASRRNPGDREARIGVELTEGSKALAARDRLEAAQRFEAVLEMDPDNERAARELAEMRRQATNERKNLLTRMLNQKE